MRKARHHAVSVCTASLPAGVGTQRVGEHRGS